LIVMNRTLWIVLSISLVAVSSVWGISSEDILRLSKAGIGSETIHVIIKEKVIETCAFSVQELIDLKTKAKISDKTIQMIVTENSFLKDRAPVVYGQDIKPLRVSTIQDIIELKQAGVSDEIIQSIIISGSGSRDEADREKAWKMLNSMGIIVDKKNHKAAANSNE